MKRIFQLSLLFVVLFAYSNESFAQKKIKEGYVVFTLDTKNNDSPELAMMGKATLSFYFTDKRQKMIMDMMGGMMKVQTFTSTDESIEPTIFMDMMGQQIQLVEIDDQEASNTNNFMNMENVADISYDEKNRKDIVGYDCYKAVVKTKDGQVMQYYITEKIFPPTSKGNAGTVLKGYPLEMTIDTGQGMLMTFVATEVSKKLEDSDFDFPTGYKKMTMEEFEKTMGNFGGFGN